MLKLARKNLTKNIKSLSSLLPIDFGKGKSNKKSGKVLQLFSVFYILEMARKNLKKICKILRAVSSLLPIDFGKEKSNKKSGKILQGFAPWDEITPAGLQKS